MAREGLNVPSPAWNTERNKDDLRAEVDAAVPTGCSEVLSVASYFCIEHPGRVLLFSKY